MLSVASSTQYSTKVIDHLGLIMATIDKLQIIDHIDERLPTDPYKGTKTTMGQRVAAMILNGLGFMNDRLYMFPEFLESKPVAKFFGEGLNAKNFNDATLGRCLDSIHAYGTTKLFTEIAMLIAVNNNLLAKSAHLDTSSLTVYGDYPNTKEGELQLTQGYAKNKRFDLKQLVLTLATTGAAKNYTVFWP